MTKRIVRIEGKCKQCGKNIVRKVSYDRVVRVFDGETEIGNVWLECPCGYSNESIGSTLE